MLQLNEAQRIGSLRRLNALDKPADPVLDGLVEVAASVCDVPISLISLVDTDRQWFMSNVGLPHITETPREVAFCSHAIESADLLEVTDATADPRFSKSRLVTGDPDIRFYAGQPLRLSNGAQVGTLCVLDRVPRELTQSQREILAKLATAAVQILEARHLNDELQASEARFRTLCESLDRSEQFLTQTGRVANVGGWEFDVASQELSWTAQTCIIHGLSPECKPDLQTALEFYAPEGRPAMMEAFDAAITSGKGWDLELPLIQATGKRIWVRTQGTVELEGDKPVRLIGAFQDITERRQQLQDLESAHDRVTIATRSGNIGVWDWNIADDKMTWTEEMYGLYGMQYIMERVSYGFWLSCVHPDDRQMAEQQLQHAIEHSDSLDSEFRVRWSDGSIRYLKCAGRVKRDSNGKAVRVLGVNWDVSPLRQTTNELAEQHELLRVTLRSIGDAVITTDAAGLVTWMNPVAEQMTGWSTSAAADRPLCEIYGIVDEATRKVTPNPVDICLQTGNSAAHTKQTLLISRDGAEYGVEDTASPIRSEHDEILGAVLVFHDVTEARHLSDEMNYRATHDSLTGLTNRAEFETRLNHTLTQAKEADSVNALMYVDLDQFKLVNDSCGHSVGDKLLQQVSKLLGQSIRTSDTLARLGGDEFGVILIDCNIARAKLIAQKMCDSIYEFRFLHKEQRYRIGASIGLVPLDNRWDLAITAMQAADYACYTAKEAGKNRVHEWIDSDEKMQTRRDDMQWASQLEQAIDENRFQLYVQRIEKVSGNAEGIHGEVLIRLTDEEGQVILPSVFLPAAERFHLATRIDRWVLERSINHLVGMADFSSVGMLCINLSGQSVGDKEFHREAIAMLTEAGAAVCDRICLEITETVAITNIADATAFIAQVRVLGVKFALDDFGAGVSSFGYLKMLDIDILKIDGQFITGMIEDKLDAAAVRCFVEVADALNLKTVAEYVNSDEVLAQVKSLGIDYAQGYLLHEPKPIESVLSSIAPPKQKVLEDARSYRKSRDQRLRHTVSSNTSTV